MFKVAPLYRFKGLLKVFCYKKGLLNGVLLRVLGYCLKYWVNSRKILGYCLKYWDTVRCSCLLGVYRGFFWVFTIWLGFCVVDLYLGV